MTPAEVPASTGDEERARSPYAPVDCPLCPHQVSLRHWLDHVAVSHPRSLGRVTTHLQRLIATLRTEQPA